MIIGHKIFHIIDQFKRRNEKIKLRWLWNSVYFVQLIKNSLLELQKNITCLNTIETYFSTALKVNSVP